MKTFFSLCLFFLLFFKLFSLEMVTDEAGLLTQEQVKSMEDVIYVANKSDTQVYLQIFKKFPAEKWLGDSFIKFHKLPAHTIVLVVGMDGKMQVVAGRAFNYYGRGHVYDIVERRVDDYFRPNVRNGELATAVTETIYKICEATPQMSESSNTFTGWIICGALAFCIVLLWEYRTKWRLRLAVFLLSTLILLLCYITFSHLIPIAENKRITDEWAVQDQDEVFTSQLPD